MFSPEKKEKRSGGIGIFTVLQIVFLVLKLTNLIDWDWIYVFMPLIVWVGLVIFLLTIVGLLYILNEIL